ncbi:MAG: O-antigen ligase family protein [Gaiellaceae bacterium]
MTSRKVTDFLFLATVFSVSFEKIHWDIAGSVNLPDVLGSLFLAAWLAGRVGYRRRPLPRSEAVLIGFLAAFVLVYLLGFYNLETQQAFNQFLKGLVKFGIHYGFLLLGVAYLARRSEEFYWRTLGALIAGISVNAVYGLLQLVVAQSGGNLDDVFVRPLTGGASAINLYGQVNGTSVYRPNALSGDPSHLAIVLLIPLLVLTPLYLRLEPGHRLRTPLAVLLPFLLLIELATLSRSGFLGLGVGLLVLAVPYRRRLASRAVLVPLAGAAAVVAAVALARYDYVETVVASRVQTGDASTSTHFGIYEFIPQILNQHPLLGLGLNSFSVYYEQITGRTNWGPHSYYVALFVETGLIGVLLYGAFLLYFFARLGAARRLGRALTARGDPVGARLRPVAWGLTAALAGIMAANAFYLTMTFYYFYAFLMLIVALPIVFRLDRSAAHFGRPRVGPSGERSGGGAATPFGRSEPEGRHV